MLTLSVKDLVDLEVEVVAPIVEVRPLWVVPVLAVLAQVA